MRVAHIITSLRAEGAQMMLYKLLSRMRMRGFDSAVISLSDAGAMGERLRALNVPVHAINMKAGLPTPNAVWRLSREVRRINPDLIQGWMYHGNLAAQLAGRLAPSRVPVFWNIRGSHYALKEEKALTAATIWLGARLSRLPARIINNSLASAAGHEQRLGYRADRRVLIPNGFDTEIFAPSDYARASVLSELGLNEGARLIALIARYHPVKDHPNFLRAASIIAKCCREAHFVLAGEGVDSNNAQLRELIDGFNLSSRVHLLGARSDTPRLMAGTDIVVLSSYAEGFPNVVGEAMACGVVCAVTDVGDAAWVVGDTGRVAQPRDPEALAAAIRDLIEMEDGRRRALGNQARQRVIEHFSLDSVARRYETLYQDAVRSTKERRTECAA